MNVKQNRKNKEVTNYQNNNQQKQAQYSNQRLSNQQYEIGKVDSNTNLFLDENTNLIGQNIDISLAQLINNTSISNNQLLMGDDHQQHNTFNPNQRVILNSNKKSTQKANYVTNNALGTSSVIDINHHQGYNMSVGGNSMALGGLKQEDLMSISAASHNNLQDTYQIQKESAGDSSHKNINTHDVYDQLKAIRSELQKVKQAKKEIRQFIKEDQKHNHHLMLDDSNVYNDFNSSQQEEDDDSDDEYDDSDQDDEEENNYIMSKIEQKYQFLMRGKVFKTLDAPLIRQDNNNQLLQKGGINLAQQINYLELNNKLIEEAYYLSKHREYVQLHMEESDLAILDLEKGKDKEFTHSLSQNNISNSYSNNQNSLANLKSLQAKRQANQNPLMDISNQGEDRHEELVTTIDINLLTNNERLTVSIPNYDNHYRLYFENPDGFAQNQEIRLNQRKMYTKVNEEKSQDFEKRLFQQFARMNESEQVDIIGKIIPQFGDCMRDLQQFRLKYCVLLDRVKKFAQLNFRQALVQDRVVEQLGILMDLKQSDQPGGAIIPNTQQILQQNQNVQPSSLQTMSTLTKKQQKNEQSKNSKMTSALPNPGFKDDDSLREIQRIKEQLGGAEQKLKDAQLQRLQEKVKGFAQTEKQLRIQISEIEQRDESLINKIENAICFGKVMFTMKPLIIKSLAGLQSSVSFSAIEKPFQAVHSNTNSGLDNSNAGKEEKDLSLLERLDNQIGLLLEQEFNDLYNELKSYKLNLQSKFCLLTDEHIIFYQDIHMLNELCRFHLSTLDFIDLGIVLQNNQVNKRVFFMKMICQNLEEKQREVYLISVYEDQIYKWDNTLEPTDDIKFQDRSFKLIKSRLLKAGVQNLKASNFDEDNNSHISDNSDYIGQTRADVQGQQLPIGSTYQKVNLKANSKLRKATLISDEGNQSAIQRMLGGGTNKNMNSDNEGNSPGYQNEVANIEKQFQDNISKQHKKLEEVGLSVDPPTPNERVIQHLQDISGTEDIQRAMDEMNSNVQMKMKQKLIQQQIQDRERTAEQQKRQLERQQMTMEYIKAFKELSLGITFLKYGRMGQPKNRHVYLNDNGKLLCWKDPGSEKCKSQIQIKDIVKISQGRETKKFKRFKNSSDQQVQLSFSIHTNKIICSSVRRQNFD